MCLCASKKNDHIYSMSQFYWVKISSYVASQEKVIAIIFTFLCTNYTVSRRVSWFVNSVFSDY